jgi:hypothetical protein
MRFKQIVLPLVISATSLITIQTNAAESPSTSIMSNFYVGGSLGYSELDTPDGTSSVISVSIPGVGDVSTLLNETPTNQGGLGSNAFIGYNFTNNWAAELNYTNYAETKYSQTVDQTNPAGSTSNSGEISYNTYSIDLFVKGTVLLKDKWSAFAKLGASYVSQDVDSSAYQAFSTGIFAVAKNGKNTYTDIRPSGALGLTYDFNQHLSSAVFGQGFVGKGDMNTDESAIASAYLIGASLIYTV